MSDKKCGCKIDHPHYEEFEIDATECKYAEVVAQRDALLAALKLEHFALMEMFEMHGGVHEDDCPLDDTCCCSGKPFNDRMNAAYGASMAAIRMVEGGNDQH